jgi:hypothetical protein
MDHVPTYYYYYYHYRDMDKVLALTFSQRVINPSLSLSLPKQGKVAKKNWVKRRRRRRRKELRLGRLGRGGRRGEGEVDEDGDLDQIRVEKVAHKGVHPTASYGCHWGKKKVDQLRQEESWPSIIKLLPLHSPSPQTQAMYFQTPQDSSIHPSIHPSIHSSIN